MKKLTLTLLSIFILTINDRAAMPSLSYPISYKLKSAHTPTHSAKTELRIQQMKSFIALTTKKYGELRGRKLNFLEKFLFKISQRRMKKMLRQYEYGDEPTTLEKISWFGKGLILGPIALIIGYLFLKDEERQLIKWIWFGFAGLAILVVALLLTL